MPRGSAWQAEYQSQILESARAHRVKFLCRPDEAAYFTASLLDGKNMFQTSQFFAIDGGWCFE